MGKRRIKWVFDILGYISTLDWASRLIIIAAPGASAMLALIISWWRSVPLYLSIPLAIFMLLLVLGIILQFGRFRRKETITRGVALTEEQKSNWTSCIKLRMYDVVCHTKAASPYLVLKIRVYNFLPVEIKLMKLKGVCDVNGAGLPKVAEDIGNKIEHCKEEQFDLRLDINGTQIPQILQGYESTHSYANWYLKGEWQIEAYGQTKMLQHDLEYSRIPSNSM